MTAPGYRSRLDRARRDRDLAALTDGRTVDVAVIGGGVVGAGVALDAASRGLSVALLERTDLAAGTSSASSKLIHGGLRYLAGGDVGLAWESAAERAVLFRRTAPHLVRPLPFLTPYGRGFGSGHGTLATLAVHVADGMRRFTGTRSGVLPGPRRVTATEARVLAPGLRPTGLAGAVEHWDGQLVDDARLVVAIARTAAGLGARIVTRCAVDRVDGGRITAHDHRTGERFEFTARAVINATGVWAGALDPAVALRPSRGVHLVVPAGVLGDLRAGLNVPVPGERNRFVFALPQQDSTVYIGLTDDPVSGPVPDAVTADAGDIGFLLDVLSRALAVPVDRADVVGTFAGMRPLVAGRDPDSRTADLSRRHVVIDRGDRLLTVVGGKLTTYRRMAADAVDQAVRGYALRCGDCRTADLPLVGAAGRGALRRVAAPSRLVSRYGTEAPVVAALADRDPALLRPAVPGVPVLGVELLYGVLAEGALEVDDLLARRTRATLVRDWAQALRPAAAEAFELADSLPA